MKIQYLMPFMLWIGILTPNQIYAQYDYEEKLLNYPEMDIPHYPVGTDPNDTRGIWMSESEFKGNGHWPPKNEKGSFYELNAKGQRDWETDLQKQIAKFENRTENPARGYPFCVDGTLPDGTNDEHLVRFVPILTSSKIEPDQSHGVGPIIADRDGKPNFGAQNSLIESVTFKNIESPSNNAKVRGIGRLNQWVHIVVRVSATAGTLEGLLIQSISGPIGLPFGEFRNDFDCTVDDSPSGIWPVNRYVQAQHNHKYDYKLRERLVNHIVPCKYRHGHAVRHPTVFAYGGSTAVSGDRRWAQPPRNMFRVHFNWEDLQCNNAASMQFLIVAVKSFTAQNPIDPTDKSNVQIFLTQAYTQKLDSGDGIPYPYHPVWRNGNDANSTHIRCTGNLVTGVSPDEYRFFVDNAVYSNSRILYHRAYDKCILTGEGLSNFSICPPGPFRCSRNLGTIKEVNDQMAVDLKIPICAPKYYKCFHPNDTEPRLNSTIEYDLEADYNLTEISENADVVIRRSRGFHAITMSASWILTIGISVFVARFYKESYGLSYNAENGCLGIGTWLWIHTGISYISFGLMWSGIIDVISIHHGSRAVDCKDYDERTTGNNLLRRYNLVYNHLNSTVENSAMPFVLDMCEKRFAAITHHSRLGWAAVLFWHLAFVTGWKRPMANFSRGIYVYMHVVFGYGGKFFAVLSTMILGMAQKSICEDIYVEIALQECVTIVGFVFGTLVQRREDKRLGLGGRKVCPVPEGIDVPDKISFSVRFLGMFTIIFQLLLIGLITLTYVYISNRTMYAPNGGNFDISYGWVGIHDARNFINGVTSFGECDMPSVKLNAGVLRLKKHKRLAQNGTVETFTFKL